MISRKLESGRFILRIDAGLHKAMKEEARKRGVSLNKYCARKLAAAGDEHDDEGLRSVVERASRSFGSDLVGIIAFGSWPRNEGTVSSDIDLAVVVDGCVVIDRKLYREWDEEEVRWQGSVVETHLLQLPEPGSSPSGMWAELAMDGIVLFDTEHRISRHLVRVRHDIVAGRIVRRTAHGQPYWATSERASE